VAWAVALGTATAAASKVGSGGPTQLVSRVTPGAKGTLSGQAVNGADVMAAVVGAMAVLALTFLIVTFIRRRVSVT